MKLNELKFNIINKLFIIIGSFNVKCGFTYINMYRDYI